MEWKRDRLPGRLWNNNSRGCNSQCKQLRRLEYPLVRYPDFNDDIVI